MENRIVVFITLLGAALLLGPVAALGQEAEATAPAATSVPVNVGLLPYVDVNSHFVRPRNHVSIDGIVGVAWDLDGVAIAGTSGFVKGRARGLQIAGVTGYVGGDLTGVQIGGILSATRGAVTGVQVAGAVNRAESLDGAQIGLVNVGGKVRGLQIGLVNVAEEADGATIGLVNIVRRGGRREIEVSTSNVAVVSVGLRTGTKHVYSLLGIGLHPSGGQVTWMPTVGIGTSIPLGGRGFFNVEVQTSAVNSGAEFDIRTVLTQLRLAGGGRPTDHLEVFAGPVLYALRSRSGKTLSDVSYLPTLVTFDKGRVPVGLGLGFVVGLRAF